VEHEVCDAIIEQSYVLVFTLPMRNERAPRHSIITCMSLLRPVDNSSGLIVNALLSALKACLKSILVIFHFKADNESFIFSSVCENIVWIAFGTEY